MKNDNRTIETELPEIRRMVLENTRRINRNELAINKLRMEHEEESRRRREHEEFLANMERMIHQSHLVHERRMSELHQLMNSQIIQHEEERKKDREEFERWKKENDKNIASIKESTGSLRESAESLKESTGSLKESVGSLKESAESLKESAESLKNTAESIKQDTAEIKETFKQFRAEFGSTVGHIVEGLLGPKGHELFKSAGFQVDRYCKDMYRKVKKQNLAMEVDVLSYGEDLAIATEVKTNCRKKDIDEYLDKMKHFKELFTEHKDKEVIAAVAAINFDRDAYEYAQQQGILIIHVIDESVFTLDPVPDKSKLRRF